MEYKNETKLLPARDREKMEKFLHSCSEFFNEGKSKYHLILYLINAGNERTPTKKELDLIYYISNDLNLPIFFICTHSKTEEASQEFKEEVKISLIQYFSKKNKGETSKTNNPNSKEKTEVSDPGPGENTGTNNLNPKDKTETDNTNPKENTETNNPGSEEKTETNNPSSGEKTETNNPNSKEKIEINSLNHKENTETNNPNLKEKIYPILEKETESIDRILEEKTRIYCCHLVNEKDRKYTRFGIEKILDGIKDLFSPQIEKIKNFEKDFIKNETAEQPLNILRSLEKSNSFVEYLKKLSMNICNKYDKKIYEIEKNKFNLDLKIETLENILKGLKEHLAFELDIDPSKFDVSSNSQANHSSKNNNQNQYSISNFWFSKSNDFI